MTVPAVLAVPALSAGATLQVTLAQSAGTLVTVVARLAGLAVFAGVIAAVVALGYRWYVRERVPSGLALLVALSGVAVVLNTTSLLAAEIATSGGELEALDALFHIAAFVGAAGGAYAGARVGDRLAIDVFASSGTGGVDADVSEIVQTVGRVTTVQLPEEIDDIVGYDPVADATRETLAGRRFLFPRRLTRAELRDRLVGRLKTDYGVGHVDVELGEDGTVEYVAIGARAAGIGPTLPPATNAVAIRADPAHAARAGDLVQVWETDPMKRVLTGELRGVAGDVVTVAIDASDTPKLDPTERYKLVTLPVTDRPDREFASLLRAADETLATITVEAGSELAGATVDALEATVAAITRDGAQPEPLPERGRTLRVGDVVYAIATPDVLRRVEAAAEGTDDARADVEPDHDQDDDFDVEGDQEEDASATGQGDDGATDNGATDDGALPPEDGGDFDGANVDRSESPEAATSSLAGDAPADGVAANGDGASAERPEQSEADEESEFPPLDVGDEDPLDDPLAGESAGDGDASHVDEADGEHTADVDAYAFDDELGENDEAADEGGTDGAVGADDQEGADGDDAEADALSDRDGESD